MKVCSVIHDEEVGKTMILYTEDFFSKCDKKMQEHILYILSLRFKEHYVEILEEIKELNDE